jgi:CBS domain-containing protein
MIARDAMTPAPLIVTRRTSVGAALRLARDNGIGDLLRALVLDEPEAVA